MSVHLGLITASEKVEAKLHEKHAGLTLDEVREAFQAPARADLRWEDHEQHGRRLVGIGRTADGREVIATFWPLDVSDGTWALMTARYV